MSQILKKILPIRRQRGYYYEDELICKNSCKNVLNTNKRIEKNYTKRIRFDDDDNNRKLEKRVKLEDEEYIKIAEKMEKEWKEREESIKRWHAVMYL